MLRGKKFLSITFRKTSFFPDEYIDGYIQLIPTTQTIMNDIVLSLYLLENWIQIASAPTGEANRELLLTMYLNIKKQLNIYTELVNLSPGTFNFPFKFKVPKKINPCFEYPTSSKKAYIRYSLDAKIISPYIQGSTSTYILFKSRPKINNQNNNLAFSSSVDIYKWNMLSEGKTTLNVKLVNDNNNIKYGDSIKLKVDIDNTNGKLATSEVKVVLIRKIDFINKKDKKIKDSISNDCVEKIFKAVVAPTKTENFDFIIELKDMDKSLFDLKNENLPYTNIKDISFFLPSVKSLILDCEYTLRATLYFNSFVGYKYRPRVLIPINISHQSNMEYQNSLNYFNQVVDNNNINNYKNTNNINNINNDNIKNEYDDELPNKDEIENFKNNNLIEINEEPPLYDAPAPVLGDNINIISNTEENNNFNILDNH